MSKMKIVIFDTEKWECAAFHPLCCEHDVVFEENPLNEDTVQAYLDAEAISIFVHSEASCDVLDKFKNLKFISTRSTGFDHVDIEYCRTHDIKVSNVPVYGDNTVAEHVFALLLAISHNIPEAINRTRQGDFSQEGLQGFDLEGKTLGVIGMGNIGKRVIEMAKGFRMHVLVSDIDPDMTYLKKHDIAFLELSALLKESDIITLHVPGNKHTHHLLSDHEFSQMKDGAVLINTARGSVVDVKALLHALADKKLTAVGLDVLPEEPIIQEEAELLRAFFTDQHNLETLLADHILLHMKNVFITPHSAFNTKEAVQRILDTTIENIKAFCKGIPQNLVT